MSKIAFVYPGQGVQTVGMAQDFYENSVLSKEVFDKADQVLDFEKGLLEYMDSKCDDVLAAIRTEKVLTEDIEAGLVKAITEYKKVFLEENKR